MSTTKIYNVGAFGIPAWVSTEVHWKGVNLIWSRHALREILDDKYGPVPAYLLPARFVGTEWELVEAETSTSYGKDVLTKFVVRRDIDAGRSLVLVITPDGPGHGYVRTAWINLTTDNHKTLNTQKFSRP